jgi:hypothetical protein
MESFREANRVLGRIGWPGEQLKAELPKTTCTLKPPFKRETKESLIAKADLAEEIKRERSEFDATEVPSHLKAPGRPSTRRRKIRVYIPSYR